MTDDHDIDFIHRCPVVDDHTALESVEEDIFNDTLDHNMDFKIRMQAQAILAYMSKTEILKFVIEWGVNDEYKSLQPKAGRERQ